MKKKKYAIIFILLLILVCFLTILLFYLRNRENKITLKKNHVYIEYGNTYNPKVDELIDLTKYDFIDMSDIKLENNVKNEENKNYPAVGKYEINVYYKKQCLKQNVEIIDTINPEVSIKEYIEIPINTDLSTYNFNELINATDLSQLKDYYFDFSKVNSNVSGEYLVKVTVEDIYSNKTDKEFKINIKENEKNIDNSENTQTYQGSSEKEKATVETKQSTNEKTQTVTNSVVENKENKQVVEEKVTENKEKEQTVENKEEPTKQQVERCTNNSNHGIAVGNSNKWFNTKEEAISYYEQLISDFGYKFEHEAITREEYNKLCPYGYEVWSCMFCNKWTINFYFREE